MSAAIRQAIADAANTVEGVTAHPNYWQATNAGSAMVRLDRITRDESGLPYWMARWALWVIAPASIETAEAWLDAHVPALVTALDPVLHVSAVNPQTFLLGSAGQVPGVAIEGTHEYEMEA